MPIFAASLLVSLSACGGDGGGSAAPKTGVPDLEASLEFTATIEGRVNDGETGEPLEGITVKLSAIGVSVPGSDASEDSKEEEDAGVDAGTGKTLKALTAMSATTDENGEWQLNVNTLGSHTLLHYGKASNGKTYARTRQTLVVSPSSHLPESATGQYVFGITTERDMYPKNGTLMATVFGDNKRDVIADARVVINYSAGSIVDPDLPTEVTTDAKGKFELKDMPSGARFMVQVRPIDRDDDGLLDTENYAQNITVYSGAGTETFIGPIGALSNPRLLWTNADSMRSFPVMPEFQFVFSHAMDTSGSSAEITLFDDNNNEIPTTTKWSRDGFQLEVEPASPLRPGRNYNLRGYAYSLEPSQIYLGQFDFRTEGGSDEKPTPAKPVLLSDPTNIGFYVNSIRIGVEPLQDIETFVIYARTDPERDWIEVQQTAPNGHTPYQDVTVSISGNEMTQVSTPRGSGSLFSHGGPLYIAVAAQVGGVPGPLSPALQVKREQCFELIAGTGTNTTPTSYADNRDGTRTKPLVIQLTTDGEQWLNDDADPTLSLATSTLVTDALEAEDFERVRVNPYTFEWRVQLPPDTDSQFVEWMIDAGTLKDVNGNSPCDPDAFVDSGLVPSNGAVADYRWDFEGGAQGWTSSGDWTRGEASYAGGSAPTAAARPDDSDAYFGTGLTASRTDSATSMLTSPTFRTPRNNAGVYFRYWQDLYPGDVLTVVFVDEDNEDAETNLGLSVSPSWLAYNGYGSLPSDTHGHLEFRFEATDSAAAATQSGVFIDDVTILGTTSYDGYCPDLTSCGF